MNKYKNLKIKSRKSPKEKLFEESFLVRAFAEIMPEVKFVDVSPKSCGKIAGDARRKLEQETSKKISTRKNFLPPERKHKKLSSKI